MTADRRSAGFTLIEIVLVLVLLGILGAAAASKYFDMQEEANRIKCAYHRSLVIDELQNRWALAVADSGRRSEIFPSAAGAESQVLEDLKGTVGARESLCPSGGTYEVSDNDGGAEDFENGYVFCVKCSTHGDDGTEMEKCKKSDPTPSEPEPGPGPQQDPDEVIIKVDNAKTLMAYLTEIYFDDQANAGKVSSIEKFFNVSPGDGSAIQSDAKGNYKSSTHDYGDYYGSMTAIVNQALEDARYVTEGIIWCLTHENVQWKDQWRDGKNDRYRVSAELTLLVVDKEEAKAVAGTKRKVKATKIVANIQFNRDGSVKSLQRENFSEKTVDVTIEKTKNDGQSYMSIVP